MVKVTFIPPGKKVNMPEGSSILQAAIAAEVPVESAYGGKGTCGKCKVKQPVKGLTPVSEAEVKFLNQGELAEGIVLACHVIYSMIRL